jgi:hypothetical protein
MKVIADQKRRVVLPKQCNPGDVFECIAVGDRFLLERLTKPERHIPPIAETPLDPAILEGVDLDEPAFPPIANESPA